MKSTNPKWKKRMSRTASPKTLAITSSARGPCSDNGDTSGSSTETFSPAPSASPLAHNTTSESAMDNQ